MAASSSSSKPTGLIINYIVLLLTVTLLVLYTRMIKRELVETTAKQVRIIKEYQQSCERRFAEIDDIVKSLDIAKRNEKKLESAVIGTYISKAARMIISHRLRTQA